MALAKSIHYGKGDTGPAFVMQIYQADGAAKDISTATSPKFYVWDRVNGTMIVDGSSTGVSIVGTNQLKRVLQTGDTAAEIEDGLAWFTYTLGGVTESTYAVGFIVSERYKRVML